MGPTERRRERAHSGLDNRRQRLRVSARLQVRWGADSEEHLRPAGRLVGKPKWHDRDTDGTGALGEHHQSDKACAERQERVSSALARSFRIDRRIAFGKDDQGSVLTQKLDGVASGTPHVRIEILGTVHATVDPDSLRPEQCRPARGSAGPLHQSPLTGRVHPVQSDEEVEWAADRGQQDRGIPEMMIVAAGQHHRTGGRDELQTLDAWGHPPGHRHDTKLADCDAGEWLKRGVRDQA